jgi:hypothetical protein
MMQTKTNKNKKKDKIINSLIDIIPSTNIILIKVKELNNYRKIIVLIVKTLIAVKIESINFNRPKI